MLLYSFWTHTHTHTELFSFCYISIRCFFLLSYLHWEKMNTQLMRFSPIAIYLLAFNRNMPKLFFVLKMSIVFSALILWIKGKKILVFNPKAIQVCIYHLTFCSLRLKRENVNLRLYALKDDKLRVNNLIIAEAVWISFDITQRENLYQA